MTSHLWGWLVWTIGIVLGVAVLWFTSVRLIGRGAPFREPSSLVQYPKTASNTGNTSGYANKRSIKLQGAANFRDLGGYETTDGHHVRWGMVYRSEALGRLTSEDLALLNTLGLRTIFDLRTPREIKRVPDRVPHNTQWVATPVQAGDFDASMLPTLLFNRKIIPDLMHQSYQDNLRENARYYGALLSRFANPENLPAVFHCTAGKDRAGLTAALLLGILGVPERTIVADYTLSNLAYAKLYKAFKQDNSSYMQRFGIPLNELHPMLIADPAWMEDALSYINAEYGNIEKYLVTAAGMEPHTLSLLRKNLLE